MNAPAITKDMQAVSDIVKAINAAWSADRAEDIRQYLHPKMVIVAPDATFRAEGRDVCVQSYIDFTRAATISRFEPLTPIVDVFGNTAVATCAFEITYEMNGRVFDEQGTDVLVFHRDRDDAPWLVVWRTTNARPVADNDD